MTLQIVAFPQDGIYGKVKKGGVKNESLMEEAIARGVDVIGGIPHYELTREDGVKSVHRIFEWAEQYDRLIDIHCDEIDDDNSRFLEVMTACAIRYRNGFTSHCQPHHCLWLLQQCLRLQAPGFLATHTNQLRVQSSDQHHAARTHRHLPQAARLNPCQRTLATGHER